MHLFQERPHTMLDKELTLRYPKRRLAYAYILKCFPSFPSNSFRVSGLILRPSIVLSSFLCRMKDQKLVPFICSKYQVPQNHSWKMLFPSVCIFFIFVRNQAMGGGWVCVWAFYSVPFFWSSCLNNGLLGALLKYVCLIQSHTLVLFKVISLPWSPFWLQGFASRWCS